MAVHGVLYLTLRPINQTGFLGRCLEIVLKEISQSVGLRVPLYVGLEIAATVFLAPFLRLAHTCFTE